jgi:dCMP deaminase
MKTTWDDRYLSMAREVSTWSKDPSTRVGAIVVGDKGQILSQGYNGFPRGIDDTNERLNDRPTKLKFVVHAEMNCIYNASYSGVSLEDSRLYVYGLPVCSECAKGVIQVGIKNVFMCHPVEIDRRWDESFRTTAEMFEEAGVIFARYGDSGRCLEQNWPPVYL